MKTEIVAALQRSPSDAETLFFLLAISQRFERIGDHATNFAEDIIYMLEANIVRHPSSGG